MGSHNSDLQAAVDATSVAKDAHATDDLAGYLREQLAERDIETTDDAWVARMIQGIEADPNYLIESEPSDFDADR
jgi:DNA-directed RNA polymerase specialized sigma54-like protein